MKLYSTDLRRASSYIDYIKSALKHPKEVEEVEVPIVPHLDADDFEYLITGKLRGEKHEFKYATFLIRDQNLKERYIYAQFSADGKIENVLFDEHQMAHMRELAHIENLKQEFLYDEMDHYFDRKIRMNCLFVAHKIKDAYFDDMIIREEDIKEIVKGRLSDDKVKTVFNELWRMEQSIYTNENLSYVVQDYYEQHPQKREKHYKPLDYRAISWNLGYNDPLGYIVDMQRTFNELKNIDNMLKRHQYLNTYDNQEDILAYVHLNDRYGGVLTAAADEPAMILQIGRYTHKNGESVLENDYVEYFRLDNIYDETELKEELLGRVFNYSESFNERTISAEYDLEDAMEI